jgi:hypothetical protein
MQGGDISNDSTRRIIVTWEAITDEHVAPRRFLGITTGMTMERSLNPTALLTLWRYTDRQPATVELACFDDADVDKRMEMLDRIGSNPFRYVVNYDSIDFLVATLAYRPDVIAVIDVPENTARYGGLGVGYNYLMRRF